MAALLCSLLLIVQAPSLANQLLSAAHGGDAAEVLKLLRRGAPLKQKDTDAKTALILASEAGHSAVVKVIVGHMQEAVTRNLTQVAGKGSQAAVAEAVLAELDKEAVINASDRNSRTALSHAAAWGRDEVVDILLKARADTTLKDTNGLTAAALARAAGHPEVATIIEDVPK